MGESSECAWVTTKYIAKQQERLSIPTLTGHLKSYKQCLEQGCELIQKLNRVRSPEEVSKEEMRGVDEAIKVSLGIYISEDVEAP